MATVALRGLTRRYPGAETAALAGLDLDVADGELLVLVGPSGCGKSTALRLLAGLDAPDAGTVTVGGRDLGGVPPQDRDVAMVFQGYALYPHLTVRDNLGFPLRMRGVPRAAREARVEATAALLGLGRLLGRRPGELSGGERQRVAMGRAIVREPKVFLFDEPLSNLDAALRAELRVELVTLVRRLGVTSLYVTHDQVEAMTMGDRIAVLRDGVLQQVAAPRVLYEEPCNAFVAGFLGSPRINLIELAARDGRLHGAGATWPAPASVARLARVHAALRPERLRLRAPEGTATAQVVRLTAEVVAAEPLGAETQLVLDAHGTRLRARAEGFDAPARGQAVELFADLAHVRWFDAETGARLAVASASASDEALA